MIIVDAGLVESVREIVNLIADREWASIEALTPGSRVDGAALNNAVSAYGRTFAHAPSDLAPFLDAVGSAESYQVSIPLWTIEEGRSDLELRLSSREVFDGIWVLQVDDVLVPLGS